MKNAVAVGLLLCAGPAAGRGHAQPGVEALILQMRQHETSIVNTYLEYQRLYYEDKRRTHELQAFEDLLTAYIHQVMEIYETLSLTESQAVEPRDIAARSLIYKALMFLEKAPLHHQYYEKACYEYYAALALYDGSEEAPALYKILPQPVKVGETTYNRLIDLIEEKGRDLARFGKVGLSFRQFRVTANFDAEQIRLQRLDTDGFGQGYTYSLAEDRIRRAFEEVFKRQRPVHTYVALPQGMYAIKLASRPHAGYEALTRFYVRANQQQRYAMEPLGDWLILYQIPGSRRPDFYRFKRTHPVPQTTRAASTQASVADPRPPLMAGQNGHSQASAASGNTPQDLIAEIITFYLPQYEVKLGPALNEPPFREKATGIMAEAVLAYVNQGRLYQAWNTWAASWEIAKRVRDALSPDQAIPLELLQLLHRILEEI